MPAGMRNFYNGPAGYIDPLKRKRQEEAQMLGQAVAKQPTQTATQTSSTGSTSLIQPRPISQAQQDLLNMYRSQVLSNPVTADDIMKSPEYQGLSQAIDFQGKQAQAGLDRSFAARNMLRSTPFIQAAKESDAYYTAQKQQLIPQLLAAAEARRQQQLSNVNSLLNTVGNVENTAFQQGVQEFNAQQGVRNADRNFALSEAAVTGQYQPQAVAQLLQAIINAKRSWANDNDGTTAAQDNANANAARQALAGFGFSPQQIDALVGSGVTLEQAQANLGRFTTPTMQARQTEAQMFGTYNGQPTLQGQAARQNLQMGQLQYDVAANPQYGLAAQAQQNLARGAADLAATQALAQQRASGGSGFTPYQQYQIDTDLADREQKVYQQKVDQYTKTFDITPAGAESWMALEEAMREARAKNIPWEQAYQQLMQPLFQAIPTLTAKDRQFLTVLASAIYGNTNAQNVLETLKRGYKPPQTGSLNAADNPLTSQ